MSDKGSNTAAEGAKPVSGLFTERELELLSFAMQCLKSGPPEVDYKKLAQMAGMTNDRSASNAWGKIKVKLMSGGTPGSAPATPKRGGAKKPAATPKGKTENGDNEAETNGGDGSPAPKKTPRKRAAKKQEVDGEPSSPKKKGGRGAKVKQESQEEATEKTEAKVKAEEQSDEHESGPETQDTTNGDDESNTEEVV
ncbi:hypothetical protein BU24DRAFT_411260 [Aaosphaeria arxii CBS 175.79]|uniref:Uncharacterized protein n=1 Tax=Aaosphaeria arxii CBS 175.79 TaxID=1450172 RepID=A0A6A5XL06_9PLEO|nr:uncharacterized protein BU24DRAFT_411260 [Aaosphaeria arxii CBS 175.79]KAF2013529.1 hypothetical protein BU24DRAFT_411260 [Aaosphaeria arxii CBS 175.79]